MLPQMRIGLFLCVLLIASPALAGDLFIEFAAFAQPHDGVAISRDPVLRAAVMPLLQHPGARLELRYPGGDEGSLRAGELRDWLVALGIEAQRIVLTPGSGEPHRIELEIKR